MSRHNASESLEYLASELFSHFLDGIGEVMFFLKDTDSQIISGNALMAEHCGLSCASDLRGKSDFDLFPHELAVHYRADDAEVFKTRKSKTNIVELFPNHIGTMQWIVCNKTPVLDGTGTPHGLLGTCQPFEKAQIFSGSFKSIVKSLDYIKVNYTKAISNQQLADLSQISIRQFERRFKQLFGTSVHQYILELRILKSCELIIEGDLPMSEIASFLGFYDQSAFIAGFRRKMGVTPLAYLKRHIIQH